MRRWLRALLRGWRLTRDLERNRAAAERLDRALREVTRP